MYAFWLEDVPFASHCTVERNSTTSELDKTAMYLNIEPLMLLCIVAPATTDHHFRTSDFVFNCNDCDAPNYSTKKTKK